MHLTNLLILAPAALGAVAQYYGAQYDLGDAQYDINRDDEVKSSGPANTIKILPAQTVRIWTPESRDISQELNLSNRVVTFSSR
ncbi:hypothetical protein E5D57_012463 [Metarhizium anisopliae]|nr:hypothetical protein E5D57_012463 [Metarhizium anisopliae]